MKGIVLNSNKGYFQVLDYANNKTITCRLKSTEYQNKLMQPCCCDIVNFEYVSNHEDMDALISKIEKRKNFIERPKVANIESCIIILSCKMPRFSSHFLSSVLVWLQAKNINPILFFTKTDLVSSEEIEEIIAPFRVEKYPIFISKKNNEGHTVINFYDNENNDLKLIETKNEFYEVLPGDIISPICFIGRSGVGKSTLLNSIFDLDLKTGEISKKLKRGKHTTTKCIAMQIQNHIIVDSPGFESFSIEKLNKEDIRNCFFNEKILNQFECSYSSCQHNSRESGCKIFDLVDQNVIKKERYESYQNLLTKAKKNNW